MQHLWAEFSERLSDTIDPNIKYGGGITGIRGILSLLSCIIRDLENIYIELNKRKFRRMSKQMKHDFDKLQNDVNTQKNMIANAIKSLIINFDNRRKK